MGAFDYRTWKLFQAENGRQITVEIFVFIVGLGVTVMVIYGIFSLVPQEMRSPDEVVYRKSGKKIGSI